MLFIVACNQKQLTVREASLLRDSLIFRPVETLALTSTIGEASFALYRD